MGETAVADRAKITLDDIVAQYTALAMTGMSHFVRIDAQGQPVIDLSRCTPADLDLLAEITVETFMDGKGKDARLVKRIKIKPCDRYQALDKLARFLGMFKEGQGDETDEDKDADGNFDFSDVHAGEWVADRKSVV